jgi:hypothetical protein
MLGILDEPEKLGKNKHSSLFCLAICDEEKSFVTVKLQVKAIRTFLFGTDAEIE